MIHNFSNAKGEALVEYLQEFAQQEDKEGTTAFYLIKSPDDEAILFFSLKCGALFRILDEEQITHKAEAYENLIHSLSEKDKDKSLQKIVEEIRSRQGEVQNILFNLNYDKRREKIRRL